MGLGKSRPGRRARRLGAVAVALGALLTAAGVAGAWDDDGRSRSSASWHDGWDGADTAGMDAESLQTRVSMVLQAPLHYPFSALANITASRGTLTEAEPRQALDAAVEECNKLLADQ
jgi:ATP-binding cassette, subfamily B, bacterial